MNSGTTPTKIKKATEADELIRFFESKGRTVSGITFNGKGIHLDFDVNKIDVANPTDSVRMD